MNTDNNRSEVEENVVDLTPLLGKVDQDAQPKKPEYKALAGRPHLQAALDEAIAAGTLHLVDWDCEEQDVKKNAA